MTETAAPTPPPSIEKAIRFMQVGAVVSAVSVVYTLTRIGELKDIVRENAIENDPNVSESTINTGIGVSIGLTLVLGGLGVLLWIGMARWNRRGRTWARVVSTGLCLLNIGNFTATAGSDQQTAISLALGVANVVVGIGALGLLYRRDASEYYAEQTYGTA